MESQTSIQVQNGYEFFRRFNLHDLGSRTQAIVPLVDMAEIGRFAGMHCIFDLYFSLFSSKIGEQFTQFRVTIQRVPLFRVKRNPRLVLEVRAV